jgi:hypothetical protein
VKKVKATLPVTASTSSDNLSRPVQQPAQTERTGCKFGWKLVAELMMAAERMGLEVPIATESDEISGFGRVRAEAECMGVPNDEIWEVVNPGLDRILGFERPVNEIESIVRRGEKGIQGFCQYLTYLIEEKGIGGGLIEGKVKVLTRAINSMYALILLQCINKL